MTQPVRRPDPAGENRKREQDTPPAGPHAREGLTDRDKTPGTGALPENNDKGDRAEADIGPD